MSHYKKPADLKAPKSAANALKHMQEALEKMAAEFYDIDKVLHRIFDAAGEGHRHVLMMPEDPYNNPIDMTKTDAAATLIERLGKLGYMVMPVTFVVEADTFKKEFRNPVPFKVLAITWDRDFVKHIKETVSIGDIS